MKFAVVSFFIASAIAFAQVATVQQSKEQALGQIVSLQADYVVQQSQTLPDGNAIDKSNTYKFYREGQTGRTRLEQGPVITITDPGTHAMYILDTAKKTGTHVFLPNVSRSRNGQANNLPGYVQQDLAGTQFLEGYEATGREFTSTLTARAIGNKAPILRTVRVWTSAALQQPLQVVISDPMTGTTTQSFKNISSGAALDPTLFEPPADYTITDYRPAPGAKGN